MRKRILNKLLFTFVIVSIPCFIYAQTNTLDSIPDANDLKSQFDYLYKKSNTYEEYKVMKISSYNSLKKNTLDSINDYKSKISSYIQDINKLNNDLESGNNEVKRLTEELAATQKIQNSVVFLGADISKSTYNTIMWGLIICLLAITGILFSLYNRGHSIVKATKKRLEEVQEEFENHRKTALAREQKLARELMDVKLKGKSNR